MPLCFKFLDSRSWIPLVGSQREHMIPYHQKCFCMTWQALMTMLTWGPLHYGWLGSMDLDSHCCFAEEGVVLCIRGGLYPRGKDKSLDCYQCVWVVLLLPSYRVVGSVIDVTYLLVYWVMDASISCIRLVSIVLTCSYQAVARTGVYSHLGRP